MKKNLKNVINNNYAYIDGNNIYRGIINSGWKIDFLRFRKWLLDKYKVSKAYYFIGLIPKEKYLYTATPITYLNEVKNKISLNSLQTSDKANKKSPR